ncbi:S41 family peptidase [Thalassotalea sediminis]|uniref:S41 family peptidase n=1 Tax=Thalassotalea sediminis TaxID=1759089 RepID=UPI002573A6DC|nr:S41 family peptidase [Thalassotalea sediminis]
MFKRLIIMLVVLNSSSLFATTLEQYHSMLQPSEVRKDIEQWLDFIDKTHPDLSYTTKDIDAFYQKVNQFKNSINKPISVREFWLEMMTYNSIISDGHVSLTPSKRKVLIDDYLKNDGTFFPFQVVFQDEQLLIKEKLNGQASNLAGHVITKINGIAIDTILSQLLKRTHGDSNNQRKALLASRFYFYYWLYFGEHKKFALEVNQGKHSVNSLTIDASNEVKSNEDSFDANFKFSVLDNKTALLTLNTFSWRKDEARVFKFLQSAFQTIKEQNLSHLIIDIRKNGGGDDNIWIKGILANIADKPWRTGSNYKAKVLAGREKEGQKAGDVVTGEISTIRQVQHDNPLMFNGKVSVLVGPYTYSSSILFMNVIQDYGFGELVGDKTGGKSGQTGGTQYLTLTHSNLLAVVPRFLLSRPKGGHNLERSTLDIQIDYDQTKPSELITKLLVQQ